MPDVTRQVETEFTLADRVTGPLRNVHAAANRVTTAFNKATATISRYGAFAATAAGVYGVGATILGAQRYLQTVRDITAATGMEAANVDAVLEVMDRANISAMEGSQIIQKMSISMQRYRMEVERTGQAQSDASRIIQKLGVDLKAGPQVAMVRMAELAQASKLSMADLNIAFQVSETSAIRLQALLRRGPQEVGRIMTNLQKQGLAVNADTIESFNRYEEATIRIRSAWNRIAIVVGGKLLPVVTDLLERVRDQMEKWTQNADEWGAKVANWLDKHLGKLITIGKIMTANVALQATMGVGLGEVAGMGLRRVGGLIGKGGAAAAAVAAAPGAVAPSEISKLGSTITNAITQGFDPMKQVAGAAKRYMDPSVLKASVKSGISAWKPPGVPARIPGRAPAGVLGRVLGRVGKVFSGIMPVLGRGAKLFMAVGPMAGKIIMLLARFTAVGLIITAIIGIVTLTYQAIQQNFLGIRDLLVQWWDQITSRVSVVWDIIKEIFGTLVALFKRVFSPQSPMGKFFSVVLATAISTLGTAVDNVLLMLQTMLIMVRKLIEEPFKTLRNLSGAFFDSVYEAQRRTAKKVAQKQEERQLAELPLERIPGGRRRREERQKPPVFDFRGSKFDIKQMFAEGFDPDRIAVAFTNDLAALGEKRIQSGLAPLFAVR